MDGHLLKGERTSHARQEYEPLENGEVGLVDLMFVFLCPSKIYMLTLFPPL